MCHFAYSIDWERTIRILSALSVPVIGAIAAYIAWQQYITNRRQLRLALFDRRIAVYDATMKLIVAVIREPDDIKLNQLFEFYSDTSKHVFLFGPEIAAYIDELSKKALTVRQYTFDIANISKQTELLIWFDQQRAEAKNKFARYMKFPDTR